MKILILILALTLPAAVWGAPSPRRDLGRLHDQFVESVDTAKKQEALDEISRTPAATPRDVKWLFDLFMRFPDPAVRRAVMSSLSLLDPRSASLEPAFIEYLKLPESEAQIFGINGALRLRTPRALPLIRQIAARRLRFKSPGETPLLSDRNAWWAQYEALSAVAQWEGAKAYPLLRRKADEAPAVARLMALYLWEKSLPQVVSWANAGGSSAEKAQEALSVDVPIQDLRATRPQMLKIVRQKQADRELRHQLALKVGICSSDEQVDGLISEWETDKDPQTRLMLSAAIFVSRNPRTIPWLKKQAFENSDPQTRLGALLQLKAMLSAQELKPLAQRVAADDPDPENRASAADLLKESAPSETP